jgi:L-threonylcarbamoyladenylate synthase
MADLTQAVRLVRAGEVIAFPTETVYGVGCDPGSSTAVERLFTLKGRPEHKPLSLHVADFDQARPYVEAWPMRALRLAETFWPGPVALILPRSMKLGAFVTAGAATVGLRCPASDVCLELLRELGKPLAGTSANLSGEPAATSADEVRAIFPDLPVVDGGPCEHGIASTIVDCTGEVTRVLRVGAVPAEAIQDLLGEQVAGESD